MTFDAFASPAQIGEIHHLGWAKAWLGADETDELVRLTKKKYPRDLTRDEASDLIEDWTAQDLLYLPPELFQGAETDR